jgi:HAE1 family hydrophobic/amphiphilic exporter-1
MLALGAVLLGGISFGRLPIDLLPDIAFPRLVVQTSYPGVAPAEVERFVTERIEQVVSAVPGVERVESESREGVSLVTLRFSWGTNMDFAALNVRERLDLVRDALPELAARPVVLRTDPTADPVLTVSVAGQADLWTLKDLAETVFRRRLEQIHGVAQAAVTGGLQREIHVDVDPARLAAHGVTLEEIAAALDAANQSAPGGTIRRGRYRYALRTLGEFQTVEEIGEVPVGTLRGGPQGNTGRVTLGDVARIDDGFEERETVARADGVEAVGILVFKEAGANTVQVTDEVGRVLERLRAEYPQVRLDIATSQARFITDAIASVVQALVLGGVLAFLVLFLFLRDVRYPVAIALAIPISVVASFALLDLTGVTLNIMSLGGLALGVGMLVDNSIVVLENVFRHRELGASPMDAAARGAGEVQGAITASTLTTISVFGPIVYVEGVAGQLFRPLSLAVAFSLLASLAVALTVLPTMAARWGAVEPAQRGSVARAFSGIGRGIGGVVALFFRPFVNAFDRFFTRFATWYHGLLAAALDHRARVVGAAAMLLAAGLAVGAMLDRGLLPDVDQGAFVVRLELPRGTPLEETAYAAERIEEVLRTEPRVAAVFTRVGRREAVAGVEEEESGLHTAVFDVRLVSETGTADVVARLRPRLAAAQVGDFAIETGTATALGRLLGGAGSDLAVRVRGDDFEAAFEHAQVLAADLTHLPRLANVHVGTEAGAPEVHVAVNRERAAAYGIEPARVAETVERAMRGAVATEFVDFDRKVPVLVRLPEAERRSLETLRLISIDGVPVSELVTTREAVGPSSIRRRDQVRTVTVHADVSSGGLDHALAAVQSTLDRHPAPAGIRVEIGGENEERARSFRDLGFAFALAVLLVYMILAAQFESFAQPFTVLLSVPLALVGATLALWLAGVGLNMMSLIGVVILVGIVVNDAIIKVDFINQMRRQGLALRESILEAGRVRLRPILMTTVTTILGLTPMALGIGSGADLRAPLALAVIGGLASATLLTLIVVPVAYDLIAGAVEGRRR